MQDISHWTEDILNPKYVAAITILFKHLFLLPCLHCFTQKLKILFFFHIAKSNTALPKSGYTRGHEVLQTEMYDEP